METRNWRKHSFRRIDTKYCLHFIRLDREKKPDNWLFIGAFEVKDEIKKFIDGHETYNLVKMDRFLGFAERLVVQYKKIPGPKQAKIPMNNIETMNVIKILEEEYSHSSLEFKGYDKVSLSYKELRKIINNNVDSWREMLENINCVYAITDTKTGKIYIGSTYGSDGVWERWKRYIESDGHGGDVELKKMIEADPNYADNFKFTIIEGFFNKSGNAEYIQVRESYWKEVFESRHYGYNRN